MNDEEKQVLPELQLVHVENAEGMDFARDSDGNTWHKAWIGHWNKWNDRCFRCGAEVNESDWVGIPGAVCRNCVLVIHPDLRRELYHKCWDSDFFVRPTLTREGWVLKELQIIIYFCPWCGKKLGPKDAIEGS